MLSPALAQQLLAQPWWFPGSAIDLDFQRDRAAVNNAYRSATAEQLTLTRATAGLAQWADGHWQSFGSGVLRRTDRGLLVEEARTNDALWSRDMTNAAWVKVNMTAALSQVGIDNAANSASLLTATVANATVLQTITLTSQADTYSVFLKRITGSGNIQITVDGGTTWTTVPVTSVWTQFQVSKTAATPLIGIRIVTNGDAVAADFNQLEPGGFATSPVLTTTVAATRNADVVLVSNISLFGLSVGTAFAEWTDIGPVSAGASILDCYNGATNFVLLGKSAANLGRATSESGGTATQFTSANAVTANTNYRQAFAFAAADAAAAFSGALNGALVPGTPTAPVGAVTGVSIGSNQVTAAVYLDSYVRRIAWFNTRLSNAQVLGWAQAPIAA